MNAVATASLVFLVEYVCSKVLDKGLDETLRFLKDDILGDFISSLNESLKLFSEMKQWEYDDTAIEDVFISLKEQKIESNELFLREILYHATKQTVNETELELWIDIIYRKIAENTSLSNYILLSQTQISGKYNGDIHVKECETIEEFIKKNSFGHLEMIEERQLIWANISEQNLVSEKISYLNNSYSNGFNFIQNILIERQESKLILDDLKNNKSVTIHGIAGIGKSGVVEEIINHLQDEKIPYLGVKLDSRIPKGDTKFFGNELGLPLSPIDCFAMLYPNQDSVLIFDQLDALRWSSAHSKTAIDVCHQIIKEVEKHNSLGLSQISLVFVTRTIDLNNDNGIKALFITNKIDFQKHEISLFSEQAIESVIGKKYFEFTDKLKALLRVPINLDIWTKLSNDEQMQEYSSTFELVNALWKNFENAHIKNTKYTTEHTQIINDIVTHMKRNSTLNIPKLLLSKHPQDILDMLLSSHILIEREKKYVFSHQSFFDCFIVKEMVETYYQGTSIQEIIGEESKQTPMLRYQLLIFLQYLKQIDIDELIQISKKILDSNTIRFYIKHCVLEVINSLQEISKQTEVFLDKYLADNEWKSHFISNAFWGNSILIEWLFEKGALDEYWKTAQENDVVFLLRSVSQKSLYLLTDFFETKKQLTEEEKKIAVTAYPYGMDRYSDKDFKCFYSMILNLDDYDVESYISTNREVTPECISKLMSLFELILKKDNQKSDTYYVETLWKNKDVFVEYVRENVLLIWNKYAQHVINETKGKDFYSLGEEWRYSTYGSEQSLQRFIVFLLQEALIELSKSDIENLKKILSNPIYESSLVMNEIFLYGILEIDIALGDEAIYWLITNFEDKSLDLTGKHDYKLGITREIIEKFSPIITNKAFSDLESFLSGYYSEYEIDTFKFQLEQSKAQRNNPQSEDTYDVYRYSNNTYGKTQAYLLPALDGIRTSPYTKSQIVVLERRFSKTSLGGYKDFRGTMASFVTSPIPNESAIKFSDKVWIEKFSNNKLQECGFSQAEHYTVSSNFKYVISMKPSSYYKLIELIDENISNYYIAAVLDVFSTKEKPKEAEENWQPFEYSFIEKIAVKVLGWKKSSYQNNLMAVARIIIERSSENWNRNFVLEILDQLLNWSPTHEFKGYRTAALNAPLGLAGWIVSALLWENKLELSVLKDYYRKLLYKNKEYISNSLIDGLGYIYNTDQSSFNELFPYFLQESPLQSIEVGFSKFYYLKDVWKVYSKKIISALQLVASRYGEDTDISENIHGFIVTNLYVVFDDSDLLYFLTKQEHSEKFWQGSISLIRDMLENFKEKDIENMKIVLNHIIDNVEFPSGFLISVLPNILGEFDRGIANKLVRKYGLKSAHVIKRILEETDFDIVDIKDIIFSASESIIEDIATSEKQKYLYELDDWIALLVELYDSTYKKNDKIAQKCLDYWDSFYMLNLGNMRDFSNKLIEN